MIFNYFQTVKIKCGKNNNLIIILKQINFTSHYDQGWAMFLIDCIDMTRVFRINQNAIVDQKVIRENFIKWLSDRDAIQCMFLCGMAATRHGERK